MCRLTSAQLWAANATYPQRHTYRSQHLGNSTRLGDPRLDRRRDPRSRRSSLARCICTAAAAANQTRASCPAWHWINIGGFTQAGVVEGEAMFDAKFKLAAASL